MHPAAVHRRTALLIEKLTSKTGVVLQWKDDAEDKTKVVIQKFSRTGRVAVYDGNHATYVSVELTEGGYRGRFESEGVIFSEASFHASDRGVFEALDWVLQIGYGADLGRLLLSSLKMAIYCERLISDAEARQDKMDSGDMVDAVYDGVSVLWPEYTGETSWRGHE